MLQANSGMVANVPAYPMTWEQAVQWARDTPEMAPLVEHCYYDDPVEDAARRFAAHEEWQAICSLLSPAPEQRVLELGAGRGVMSWAFANAGCEVFAIEPDPSAVVGAGAIRQLCAATEVQITLLGGTGEAIPLPDNSLDIVVCRAMLHHVRDLPKVCREVFRVLRPGGTFLAMKEHVAEGPDELVAFKQLHPLHHLYGGEHAFGLNEYRAAIRDAGFRSLRSFGPFDNAVSCAPPYGEEDHHAALLRTLAARLPLQLARWLAAMPIARMVYRRWLSLRCRTPGRPYSFLATKSKRG